MPTIIAKFITQMESGTTWPSQYRMPNVAASPSIASRSGSPIATSDPNARTRTIITAGQAISSPLSIDSLLTRLKSAHIAAFPVTSTCIPSGASSRSASIRSGAMFAASSSPAVRPTTAYVVFPSSLTSLGFPVL